MGEWVSIVSIIFMALVSFMAALAGIGYTCMWAAERYGVVGGFLVAILWISVVVGSVIYFAMEEDKE